MYIATHIAAFPPIQNPHEVARHASLRCCLTFGHAASVGTPHQASITMAASAALLVCRHSDQDVLGVSYDPASEAVVVTVRRDGIACYSAAQQVRRPFLREGLLLFGGAARLSWLAGFRRLRFRVCRPQPNSCSPFPP